MPPWLDGIRMIDNKETAIIDGLVYRWNFKNSYYLVFCDTVWDRRLMDRGENYWFDDCQWMVLE